MDAVPFQLCRQAQPSQLLLPTLAERQPRRAVVYTGRRKQKLDYIHRNPVRSGIVSRPEDYLYSSAADYAGLKGLIEVDAIVLNEFV